MWTTGNDVADGALILLALPWILCALALVFALMFVYICLVVKVFAVGVDYLIPPLRNHTDKTNHLNT